MVLVKIAIKLAVVSRYHFVSFAFVDRKYWFWWCRTWITTRVHKRKLRRWRSRWPTTKQRNFKKLSQKVIVIALLSWKECCSIVQLCPSWCIVDWCIKTPAKSVCGRVPTKKMGRRWAPFSIHSCLLKGLAWKSKNASIYEPVNMRPGPRLVVMVALAFISGAQSSTNQQQSQSSIRGKLLSKRDESANYDETSPAASTSLLSNINPWLSACDLAQPNSAPDLQVTNLFNPSHPSIFWLSHFFETQRIYTNRIIRKLFLSWKPKVKIFMQISLSLSMSLSCSIFAK